MSTTTTNRYSFLPQTNQETTSTLKNQGYQSLKDKLDTEESIGYLIDNKAKVFWRVNQENLDDAREVSKTRDGQTIDEITIENIKHHE